MLSLSGRIVAQSGGCLTQSTPCTTTSCLHAGAHTVPNFNGPRDPWPLILGAQSELRRQIHLLAATN